MNKLIEILIDDSYITELKLLYDQIIDEKIPLTVTIGPDGLDRYQDAVRAAIISVLGGAKGYSKPS